MICLGNIHHDDEQLDSVINHFTLGFLLRSFGYPSRASGEERLTSNAYE